MFRVFFIFLSIILGVKCLCPNESLEYQTNCYFFKNASAGFAIAEFSCSETGGHLISIHDSFIDALIAQEGGLIFHESTVTDFWIGLTLSGGNWTWMDGTPLDFIDWAPGEPKNLTGSQCAGLSVTDGYWRSDDCFKEKPYVCKVEKSYFDVPTTTTVKPTTTSSYPVYADCPYPFTYFQPTHSCYGAGNWTDAMNWSNGEQYCQHYGARLASIHSSQEMHFIGSESYMWNGAFSNDGGNSWKWSDGTPWDYVPWSGGYPLMHASACGVTWGWSIIDQPCTALYRVLCKKPL